MYLLEIAFILGCTACGWLGGYSIWKFIGRTGTPAALAAMRAPAPERLDPPIAGPGRANMRHDGPHEPVLEGNLHASVRDILALLREQADQKGPAEDRLLSEIRAAVSADDPEIRIRLDRIEQALGIESDAPGDSTPPEAEAEDMSAEDMSAQDATGASVQDWQAEFSEDTTTSIYETEPVESAEVDMAWDDGTPDDGTLAPDDADSEDVNVSEDPGDPLAEPAGNTQEANLSAP